MISDDTTSGQNDLDQQQGLDQEQQEQLSQLSEESIGAKQNVGQLSTEEALENDDKSYAKEDEQSHNSPLSKKLDLDTDEQQTDRNNSADDDGKAHENQLSELRDIPVKVTAILGSTRIRVSDLAKLDIGQVVELDKKVGDQLDIYVNNRLVAHGEVVISDDHLGISLTEIIKNKD